VAGAPAVGYEEPRFDPGAPADDNWVMALHKVSWGAVLAGIVTALVVQFLLNLLGLGLGLATLEPASAGADPTANTAALIAAAWWTGSGIVAAFIGGLSAGRLSGKPKGTTTGWHGFVSWAGTTLVLVYLITSAAGTLVGGTLGTVGRALGGLSQTAAQAAASAAPALAQIPDPFAGIEQQIRSATGGNDPAALRDAAISAIRAAVTSDEGEAEGARERAAQALARAQNTSVEEARSQLQQYEQQFRQAVEGTREQVRQAAAATAPVVARGALIAFGALALGAFAGWLGGRVGGVRPIYRRRRSH
jgi:hypothetical protein